MDEIGEVLRVGNAGLPVQTNDRGVDFGRGVNAPGGTVKPQIGVA